LPRRATSPRPKPARLPYAFWIIWASLLINKAGGFVMVMMTIYLTQQRDLSLSMTGIVVGAHGAGAIGGMLTGGVLTDRIGRKKTIVTSMFATTAVLGVLVFATNVFAIAALVTVLGFVSVMAGPASVAAIADVVEPDERSRAFNIMYWAQTLGMGAAVLLGGLLAAFSFPLLFALDALSALAAGLLVFFGVRESLNRGTDAATGEPEPDRGTLGTVLRDRPYMLFVGLTFMQALMFSQTSSTLPLAMTSDGLTETQFGMALACGTVLVVLGQLFVPRLIERFGKAQVLAVSLAGSGLGFGLLGFANTFAMYVSCVLVWTVASMLAAPPNATIIAELSPGPMRGRYQGVFSVTFAAAAFVAPTAGGFTLQYLGDWHWAIVALVGVAAAAFHLLTGPARERAARERAALTAANSVKAA